MNSVAGKNVRPQRAMHTEKGQHEPSYDDKSVKNEEILVENQRQNGQIPAFIGSQMPRQNDDTKNIH